MSRIECRFVGGPHNGKLETFVDPPPKVVRTRIEGTVGSFKPAYSHVHRYTPPRQYEYRYEGLGVFRFERIVD